MKSLWEIIIKKEIKGKIYIYRRKNKTEDPPELTIARIARCGAERGAGPRPAALGAGDAGSGAAMGRLLPPVYRALLPSRAHGSCLAWGVLLSID